MNEYQEKHINLLKDKIAELTCDCISDLKHEGWDGHQFQCACRKVFTNIETKALDGAVPYGAVE